MKTQEHESAIIRAQLERPRDGVLVRPDLSSSAFELSDEPVWQSNGGPSRGHYARSLPFSLELKIPEAAGPLTRVHLVGVFAMFADRSSESVGTLGATVHLLAGDREILTRFDLVNGRHYCDAADLGKIGRVVGDGTSIENIGECEFRTERYRIDALTLDIPPAIRPKRIAFRDLGSPASFAILDAFFEFDAAYVSGGDTDASGLISLGELGSAIRVGDRVKFGRALDQLNSLIEDSEHFDDARARAVTFLSVVLSALHETTGNKPSYTFLLNAVRDMETATTRLQLQRLVRDHIADATEGHFGQSDSPSDKLIDRALAIVERHYAREITDAMVAAQLGLSTSHFRFLFRQATGHPFHKFVVAMRLEKAKQMLVEQELPVSQVAAAVGFTGLSHFSRAFTQRFAASPSHIRRAAG